MLFHCCSIAVPVDKSSSVQNSPRMFCRLCGQGTLSVKGQSLRVLALALLSFFLGIRSSYIKKKKIPKPFERILGCECQLSAVVLAGRALPTCYRGSVCIQMGYYKAAGSFRAFLCVGFFFLRNGPWKSVCLSGEAVAFCRQTRQQTDF